MVKQRLKWLLERMGYSVSRLHVMDMEPGFMRLYERCKPYTMTSPERMYSLYKACEYVARAGLPGALAECGVWRGGSAMMMALTLKELGEMSREIYLYDTYAGMSEPSERDVDIENTPALTEYEKGKRDSYVDFCYAPLDEVKANVESTGYPSHLFRFVKGPVEETIPGTAPDSLALLRLDTDWYRSTYHELEHLYPRLVTRGPLIIDDYGHWRGAREAVDSYFAKIGVPLLLNRIDHTGRIAVKP